MKSSYLFLFSFLARYHLNLLFILLRLQNRGNSSLFFFFSNVTSLVCSQ